MPAPELDLGPAILAVGLAMRDLGGAIIGGVAISLGTRARMTSDVDAVVRAGSQTHEQFAAALIMRGFSFREGGSIEFARANQIFLLRHDGTGVPVDIAFGWMPFEENAIAMADQLEVAGERIPVARPEDLAVMKVFAGRPRDVIDVGTLLQGHPDIDRAFIEREVRLICDLLEDDERLRLWHRLATETPKRTNP